MPRSVHETAKALADSLVVAPVMPEDAHEHLLRNAPGFILVPQEPPAAAHDHGAVPLVQRFDVYCRFGHLSL